jgi:hypothetical protein
MKSCIRSMVLTGIMAAVVVLPGCGRDGQSLSTPAAPEFETPARIQDNDTEGGKLHPVSGSGNPTGSHFVPGRTG